MAADFKSHVLRRDEKGFVGVPFKRLLLAGVSGGLAYTVVNLGLPGWSIVVGIGVAVVTLVLTGHRGGLPLWQRLLFGWRGSLLLMASHQPDSFAGQVVRLLNLNPEAMRLQGDRLFALPAGVVEVDLREWITFASAQEPDGLVFVESPIKELSS